MKTIILLFLNLSILFTQDSSIFYESSKEIKQEEKIIGPDLMISVGSGMLFHQGNELFGSSYSDNPFLQFEINKYFFQGLYLNLTSINSRTNFTRVIDKTGTKKSDWLTYQTFYVGLNYYTKKQNKFENPWSMSLAFGQNSYNGEGGESYFSTMIKVGKLLDYHILSGQVGFDMALLMHEERGIQYYRDNYNSNYDRGYLDYVFITSFKLTAYINFELTELD